MLPGYCSSTGGGKLPGFGNRVLRLIGQEVVELLFTAVPVTARNCTSAEETNYSKRNCTCVHPFRHSSILDNTVLHIKTPA